MTEAEYVILSEARREIAWIVGVLCDIGVDPCPAIVNEDNLYKDSRKLNKLSKNKTYQFKVSLCKGIS